MGALIINILIPLAVGGLSALLTNGDMHIYAALNQPPLAPPSWLFPVIWSLLYIMMGIAAYLVWKAPAPRDRKTNALGLYALQLGVNFAWPVIFFKLNQYLFSFIWLLLLIILIILTMRSFARFDKKAANLLIPYLLWSLFAAYLNLGIYLLNG